MKQILSLTKVAALLARPTDIAGVLRLTKPRSWFAPDFLGLLLFNFLKAKP